MTGRFFLVLLVLELICWESFRQSCMVLRIAWDKGYRNVSCLHDSLDAIKLIKVSVPLLHIFNHIVVDIQDMLTR